MRKLEIIRAIATIVLAIVATIIMCIMIFKPEVAQADDIVTMAVLNQYKEEVQLKIDDLNATITELKEDNGDLKEEITKLKKADSIMKETEDNFKSDIRSINNKISDIQAREKYFYDKVSKTDYHYISTVAKQVLANLY